MNPIDTILQNFGLVILDGALATELERRGADLNDPLWSARLLLEEPDLIREVHADYFRAGADCAITASYQATFPGFARRGLGHQAASELMRRSVRLACDARDAVWATLDHTRRPHPLVAASIGPYGAFLHDGSEYRGDYTISDADLLAFHRPRMAVLSDAGADLLALETIPSFREAQLLLRLLEEFPQTWAWMSFSARDGQHISDGTPFATCVAEIAQHPQVAAVGVNCTAPGYVAELLRVARDLTTKPLLAYPNSGEIYDPATHAWCGIASVGDYAAEAQKWYAEGASILGGCCRTTPDHIRAIAAWARAAHQGAERV
ncbi:homocysteine S-methyltransferase [Oscillochloris trichoides DG-6]|uniref:S-methylmethionine:homocysteine methyltransferase n=1 Tax=Oscillochloris trichoides DG-6 TaxID=765420 RepID=E1ICX9_9CHLR|nr:homocysteine S-methyltransferase [Oscillochloris trichoides]EFO80949.1 homocysteine S-methyltransferase [Oscillochloris trichoides DG-6]